MVGSRLRFLWINLWWECTNYRDIIFHHYILSVPSTHDVSWSRAQSQPRHFTRKYNCVPFQSSKPRPNKREYRYWQLYRLKHPISSYRELAFLYKVSMLKRFPYSLVFSMSCTVVAARASFYAFAHRLREMVHNLAWDLLIDLSQT